jgi:predicted nucleotide-binding protein
MIRRGDRRSAFSEVALGHWFHLLRSVADKLQNLFAREIGWRFMQSSGNKGDFQQMGDRSKVFVVHGRNERIRRAMFSFLRAINLQPLEWNVVVNETGKGAPTIDEILKVGFGMAQAAVVLLTGDDEARLREEYLSNDSEMESILTPQARQNVLYEAGMAMGRHPDRTILVEIPPLRPFTDIAGIYTIRMDNSIEKRQILANALERVGCDVQLKGTAWHTEGDFTSKVESKSAGM